MGYVIFQATGQIIPIAAAPIITRIYTSAEYGVLGLFGAVVAVGMALSTGRYQRATLLADNDTEAVEITRLALLCTAAFSIVILVTELLSYPLWHATRFAHELGFWVFVIPVSTFVTASYDCFLHYGLRGGQLRAINWASINRAGVNVGSTIGFGLAGWGASGTIAGTVLAQITSSQSLSRQFTRASRSVPHSWVRLRTAAVRHRNFPLYDVWANLALTLTYNLIPIGLAVNYSTAVVGLYSLSYRLLALPADLIGTSMGELYFRNLSAVRSNAAEARRMFRRTLGVTALASLPAVAVAPLAPWLFGVIFGSGWKFAGYLTIAMMPHVVARLICTPLFSTYAAYGRQRELLAGQASLLIVTISAFAIGRAAGLSVTELLSMHSLAMAAIYAVLLLRAWRVLTLGNTDER